MRKENLLTKNEADTLMIRTYGPTKAEKVLIFEAGELKEYYQVFRKSPDNNFDWYLITDIKDEYLK